MFDLGSATVSIRADDSPLARGLEQSHGRLAAFAKQSNAMMRSAGRALLGASVAAGSGLSVALYKAVQRAGDLNETLSKVGAVFGPEAVKVIALADRMADSYGTSKQEILDAAAGIGLIGKAAGQANSKAAALSSEMAQLAVDAASFFNVPVADALGKIRSGLVGESEPLRAFGVLLSETAVQAEAFRLGLTKKAKDSNLTESQKVEARASLITSGLAPAKGDQERTAGSPSNLEKTIGGRLGNAMAEVGLAVLPVWADILDVINSGAAAVARFITQNKDTISSWATGAMASVKDLGSSFAAFLGSEGIGAIWSAFKQVGGVASEQLGVVKSAIENVSFVLRNFDDLAAITGISLVEAFTNAGETVGWLAGVVQDLGGYFAQNWRLLALDAINAVSVGLRNLGDNVRSLMDGLAGLARGEGFELKLKPIFEDFKSTAPGFKVRGLHLSDYGDQKQERLDKIAAREAQRAGGGPKPPAQPDAKPDQAPTAAAAQQAKAERKTEFFGGGQDFRNAIQKTIFDTKGNVPEQQLKTAEAQLDQQKQTNALLEKAAGLPPALKDAAGSVAKAALPALAPSAGFVGPPAPSKGAASTGYSPEAARANYGPGFRAVLAGQDARAAQQRAAQSSMIATENARAADRGRLMGQTMASVNAQAAERAARQAGIQKAMIAQQDVIAGERKARFDQGLLRRSQEGLKGPKDKPAGRDSSSAVVAELQKMNKKMDEAAAAEKRRQDPTARFSR